jgi:hypothetical protein
MTSRAISTIDSRMNLEYDLEALRLNGRSRHGAWRAVGFVNALVKVSAIAKDYLGQQDPKDLDGTLPALIDKTLSLRRARSFRASITAALADFARGWLMLNLVTTLNR